MVVSLVTLQEIRHERETPQLELSDVLEPYLALIRLLISITLSHLCAQHSFVG